MPLFSKKHKVPFGTPEKLVVGLGNPGSAYSGDRHNIGFMVVSMMAKDHHLRFDRKRGKARVAEGEVGGRSVELARPQTYMNASGEAVRDLLDKLKLSAADLIVIHDDLDLPLGRIRVRMGGSAGGHNGIKSIIGFIGTSEFVRVRVGIGRPVRDGSTNQRKRDVVDYVLTDFDSEEREIIGVALPKAVAAVECLVERGLTETMNRFNAGAPAAPGASSTENGADGKTEP